jgi:sterol desaturase/sphingolipid hydroxylase (fatty acid hydroxylase superfamily)
MGQVLRFPQAHGTLQHYWPCGVFWRTEAVVFIGSGLWDGRTHHLDKMTLNELVKAYFAFPAIQIYIVVSAISIGYLTTLTIDVWQLLLVAALSPFYYGLIWYGLHRYVLHGHWLYKSPLTAPVWKRIHFDHHQDPNNLGVLFGAPYTTLPTILIATIPYGWLLGGMAGAALAVTLGLLLTCFYEFCHCIEHLRYAPETPLIKRMKKLHLAHHFHSEKGNYGITDFSWDRVFQTFYPEPKSFPRSETVFNLGYDGEESIKYPWVAKLSGHEPGTIPSRPPAYSSDAGT